jgi:hypothetical protein
LFLASELFDQLYCGFSNAAYWEEESNLEWQQKNGFEFPPAEEEEPPDEREPEDVIS